MEADFQKEYNLELAECLWGKDKISARRLVVLISQLGSDTGTAKYFTKGWDMTQELLATLIELQSVSRLEFLAANGVKQGQLPRPIQVTRPYLSMQMKEREKASLDDIKEIFGRETIIREPKEVDNGQGAKEEKA